MLFKCRAETRGDIIAAQFLMTRLSINWADDQIIPDPPFPDCEWVFTADTYLEILIELFMNIPDGHVIVQTLEYSKDYTGIRKYDR